jgi:hypothetical protein
MSLPLDVGAYVSCSHHNLQHWAAASSTGAGLHALPHWHVPAQRWHAGLPALPQELHNCRHWQHKHTGLHRWAIAGVLLLLPQQQLIPQLLKLLAA